MKIITRCAATAFALGLAATACHGAVTIEWVTIGDPGDSGEPSAFDYAVGVAYTYRVASTLTSLNQYTAFLNAAAANDPYGLHHPNMDPLYPHSYPGESAGIIRDGSPGTYNYTVAGDGSLPVLWVSWFSAARFINWLHNGQGAGTTETGIYQLNGATSGFFTSAPDAVIRLATGSEWSKAFFFDPSLNGGAGGYSYSAINYYGAIAGPVPEWTDDYLSSEPSEFDIFRGMRGPTLYDHDSGFPFQPASSPSSWVGFRVASPIPEPGVLLLSLLAPLILLRRNRSSVIE